MGGALWVVQFKDSKICMDIMQMLGLNEAFDRCVH